MTLATKAHHALNAAWGYALANLVWYGLVAGVVWLGFYVLPRTRARRCSRTCRSWAVRSRSS